MSVKGLSSARRESGHRAAGLARRGFTLVELLVVIAIIGVLVALLLPAVQAAREAARRTQCTNNVKQLGLSLLNHHDVKKAFPPGIDRDQTGTNGKIVASWQTHLLPYLEQQAAYDAILWDKANYPLISYDPNLDAVVNRPNNAFRCPSAVMDEVDPSNRISGNLLRFGTSNYRGCRGIRDNAGGNLGATQNVGWWPYSDEISGLIGVLYPATNDRLREPTSLRQITDGTTHTIAIGEVDEVPHIPALQANPESWRSSSASDDGGRMERWPTWPGSHGDKDDVLFNMWSPVRSSINSGDRDAASASHSGGVNFGLCDGSVQFLSENVVWDVYAALGTRSGSETQTNIE